MLILRSRQAVSSFSRVTSPAVFIMQGRRYGPHKGYNGDRDFGTLLPRVPLCTALMAMGQWCSLTAEPWCVSCRLPLSSPLLVVGHSLFCDTLSLHLLVFPQLSRSAATVDLRKQGQSRHKHLQRDSADCGGGQRRALLRLELWEASLSPARNKCLPVLQT